MNQRLFIITGSSRGLGSAMAEQVLQADVTLLGIARNIHPTLEAQARASGGKLEQWSCNLAESIRAAQKLTQWLQQLEPTLFTEATLINNAGFIAQPGPVRRAAPYDIEQALQVGLHTPIQLANAFLRETADWPARRRVLNVSSGLGQRAMAGVASYCAAKAGLDHFSRAVALEEADQPNGARIVSLAPGIIDTDMQTVLRSANVKQFPDQARFADLKNQGQLTSPQEAAKQLLQWLDRDDFGTHPVADVRS